ncbi:SH3 domain-containing protein [Sphingomonas sp.]|uniref:SH3 domain-containing protein n=1 Tax=Sphingomonas sp. TaxID=28214 RepID=UPI0025D84403|nr:SH3 domain-containing protein [Sphingomonas sp.]
MDAVRGDLADVELADRVFAPHYAKACAFTVIAETALRIAPSTESEVVGKLGLGDQFDLLDISGEWGWGRGSKVVGYVSASAIKPL